MVIDSVQGSVQRIDPQMLYARPGVAATLRKHELAADRESPQRLQPLDHRWHKWNRAPLAGLRTVCREPPEWTTFGRTLEIEFLPAGPEQLALAHTQRE